MYGAMVLNGYYKQWTNGLNKTLKLSTQDVKVPNENNQQIIFHVTIWNLRNTISIFKETSES